MDAAMILCRLYVRYLEFLPHGCLYPTEGCSCGVSSLEGRLGPMKGEEQKGNAPFYLAHSKCRSHGQQLEDNTCGSQSHQADTHLLGSQSSNEKNSTPHPTCSSCLQHPVLSEFFLKIQQNIIITFLVKRVSV